MNALPDWQAEAAYRFSGELAPSGAAWEFLRRHPAYRRDWADAQASSSSGGSHPPAPDALRRWGVHFPGRSRPRRP